MAALPDDDLRDPGTRSPRTGRDDTHAEVDEPSASLAWRILTSPRTFGVLALTMSVLLVLAAVIPQRPLVEELAHELPFAFGEAARNLGLDDVFVSWPFLLVALLMALNLTGLWLASRLGRTAVGSRLMTRASTRVDTAITELKGRLLTAMGGRVAIAEGPDASITATRGFLRDGLVVAAIGVVTLLASLAVSRSSAIDGRLALVPGASTLPESTVRDGDLVLLRQLPLGLFCGRPDPQDTTRTFPCRAAVAGSAPIDVQLTPGHSKEVGGFTVTPLSERLRVPLDTDPYDLVIHRDGAMERIVVAPNKTVELKRGGEHITALTGPDGPLVVVQQVVDGKAQATLLMPAEVAPAGLRFEVEHPTTLTLAATTAPEWPLVLAGLGLVVIGLILAAALPHLQVVLVATPEGTHITVSSANRTALVHHTLAALTLGATPTRTRPLELWLRPIRADLKGTVLAVVTAGLGLGLGLLASPSTPAFPLALATLIALGTRTAPIFGLGALVAGLGTVPDPAMPVLFDLFAAAVAGLGLGTLGRWLAQDETLAKSPYVTAGLLVLAIFVLHLMPSPPLALVDSSGRLLSTAVTLADGPSAMQVFWPVATYAPGQANTLTPLLLLGLPIAVLLFALHQRPDDRRARLVAQIALGFGVVAVIAGVLGLVQLFGSGSTESEILRHRFDLASADATTLAAPTITWELRLWSRPFLDGLTLVAGLFVALSLLPVARGLPAPSKDAAVRSGSGAHVLITAALLSLMAFLLAKAHGAEGGALFGTAAAVTALAALVSARDPKALLMPSLLLIASATLTAATWLLPSLVGA